jgi:hypothetical protein
MVFSCSTPLPNTAYESANQKFGLKSQFGEPYEIIFYGHILALLILCSTSSAADGILYEEGTDKL